MDQLWNILISWQGWKKIFCPNPVVTVLFSVGTAWGLCYVFSNGLETSALAYLLYPVSAYALLTLIILLWKKGPEMVSMARRNPILCRIRNLGGEGAFDLGFYAEQLVNFCYGGFKLVSGLLVQSVWIWTDGIYNFVQGLIQLYQLLRHRKSVNVMDQWKAYRQCGWMMIIVNLTMTGLVFQMIHMGRHEENTEISMIATAAFTFYKLIHSLVDVAKDRKHKSPVDSAVRFLDLGQALYNLFVLQVGLLWTFGAGQFQDFYLLNTLTGFAVCILVCGIGIYMLWRSKRDMKALSDQK